MQVEGSVSEAELPPTTRIVADRRPTYLARFSVDATVRQAYERQLDQAARNANTGFVKGEFLYPQVIVLLPLGLMIDSANAYRRAEQRLRDAGLVKPISDEDGERLAALFEERATSAALTRNVVALRGSSSREIDYPRLTIRVDTIQLENRPYVRFFQVIAYAQVHTAPDVAQPRTEHTSSFTYRGDGPTKRGIDAMLAVLSQSIMMTYFPNHPSSVEYRHWERVSGSFNPAEVKTYLEQYPEGRFAEPARKQLAEANKWVETKARAAAKASDMKGQVERSF